MMSGYTSHYACAERLTSILSRVYSGAEVDGVSLLCPSSVRSDCIGVCVRLVKGRESAALLI